MAILDKFADRLGEPLHLNLLSVLVALFGRFDAKVAFDLVERRPYAFGVLDGALEARRFGGPKTLYAVEFGVAGGRGLRSLNHVCREVSRLTGFDIQAVGFDTGEGLPPPRDFRDHPELWGAGDYPPCPRQPNVIYGDIADTGPAWIGALDGQLCFVSVDVDLYSSANSCLRTLEAAPIATLPPYLPVYFDDTHRRAHNPWAGELLAIEEFNARNAQRKLAPVRGLRERRIMKRAGWIGQMHQLHAFDHPLRSPSETPAAAPGAAQG